MLLVTPGVVLIAAFVLFPLGFAVYVSLTNWPLIGPYHYVGLQNYRLLAHDPEFRHAIQFTMTYTAIVTAPIFFVGYGLAMLVHSNRRGSTVFRTLFFLPFVVGLTTESYLFSIELQPNSGSVDFVLSKLGLVSDSQAWTVSYHWALIAISGIVIWFASGLTMLILVGGMQSIPRELHEAAEVDGASWWDRELRITFPLLRRSIALSLIVSVIGSFLAFNQFFILAQNNVGPRDRGRVDLPDRVHAVPPRLRDRDGTRAGGRRRVRQHHPAARLQGHDRAMSTALQARSTPATIRAARRKRGAFLAYFSASSLLALVFTLPLLWVVMRSLQPATLASRPPQHRIPHAPDRDLTTAPSSCRSTSW